MSTSTKTTPAAEAKYDGFTAAERDAMKERARELKSAKGKSKDTEPEVLAKLAGMGDADRVIGERLHAVIKEHAPELTPRLWYGMPAYTKGGKILCHFQPAEKFATRYATFTFSDVAALDDGAIWPTSFAVPELTPAVESRIGELLRKAVG